MMEPTPFDPAPDAELGGLLREALTGPEPEAFLRRMRAAIQGQDNQWDVLERWARPRLVAAAVAAGLILWLGVRQFAERQLDTGVMVASNRASTVLSPQPPSPDEILASLWETR
jgi:hypothetical protein